MAARRIARLDSTISIVTGANVAMLLDFAFHREQTPAQAAARAAATGKGSITAVATAPAHGTQA